MRGGGSGVCSSCYWVCAVVRYRNHWPTFFSINIHVEDNRKTTICYVIPPISIMFIYVSLYIFHYWYFIEFVMGNKYLMSYVLKVWLHVRFLLTRKHQFYLVLTRDSRLRIGKKSEINEILNLTDKIWYTYESRNQWILGISRVINLLHDFSDYVQNNSLDISTVSLFRRKF